MEGFDANALYLFALMQHMPTGIPVVRKKSDNFQPKQHGKYGLLAREWVEWMSHLSGHDTKFKHKFNEGEQRLGKRNLPVDGWDPLTKTAYQFHGCAFHSCKKYQVGKKAFPTPFQKRRPP